jgi:hypothetical protein
VSSTKAYWHWVQIRAWNLGLKYKKSIIKAGKLIASPNAEKKTIIIYRKSF